ncbi:MAG: TonB-dependent receptor [Gemmatimonadales bacterium]
MSRRLTFSFLLVLASSVETAGSSAGAQQLQVASRGPRFIVAGASSGAERDASGAVVLHRRVTLDLNGVTTDEALKEITRQADLEITYSPRVVALERRVSLHAREITVAAALTEVLLEAGVDVSVTAGGHLALVKRALRPAPPVAAVDTGAVAGRVTDAESGSSLVGATVTIEGTRRSATTDAEGRYRIGGLAPGGYTLRARYIGYTPAAVSVMVGAGEEATADFALARSPHELDQVVVTGTIVPTELKAVPTPVSVITEEDIERLRPRNVQELLRQEVPTAVSWNQPNAPYYTAFAVRGASTLAGQVGQMKIFLDGVEAGSPSLAAIDPSSIARIEVVRGPQAAAIYGSDAIGGVIQVFTKRGYPGLSGPQLNAEAALGALQTPYDGRGAVLRQEYKASVRGGDSVVSYNLGGGYSRTGDFLPNDDESRQSSPGVYGGVRYQRGIIAIDLSGRYYAQNTPVASNPELSQTGVVSFSRPAYRPQQIQNQTIGAQFQVSPTTWWHANAKVGLDRVRIDAAQSRRRLRTPTDTLFFVSEQSWTKTSIGLNTAVQGALSPHVSGSLTVGFDHYSWPISEFSTSSALSTTGAIVTAPDRPIAASRSVTNNTGYFAQAQWSFRETLFLTAGLRAEQNTNFGDSLGTPVSPRVGLSYVQPVGGATVKFRGAYGRAVRAPAPGQELGQVSSGGVVLANPELGPERQQGWDVGIDALLGDGVSLSATYYDQTAKGLIQPVQLPSESELTFQNQNVGRVRNTGVEIEGTMSVGPLRLGAQYGYARARIEELAPGYAGELLVGDQTPGTPKHTAGASLTIIPYAGITVGAGLAYVGSWNATDFVGLFRCFGGTSPCQPTARDYIIAYPGFAKLSANAGYQLTAQLSAFIAVDNLTNNHAFELDNAAPVTGRLTTVGARLRY